MSCYEQNYSIKYLPVCLRGIGLSSGSRKSEQLRRQVVDRIHSFPGSAELCERHRILPISATALQQGRVHWI